MNNLLADSLQSKNTNLTPVEDETSQLSMNTSFKIKANNKKWGPYRARISDLELDLNIESLLKKRNALR